VTIVFYVLAVIVATVLVIGLALWRLVRIMEAVGYEPGGLALAAHAEGETCDEKVETTSTVSVGNDASSTDIDKTAACGPTRPVTDVGRQS